MLFLGEQLRATLGVDVVPEHVLEDEPFDTELQAPQDEREECWIWLRLQLVLLFYGVVECCEMGGSCTRGGVGVVVRVSVLGHVSLN